jgi:5-methylcytosine-specific restriction endonuclease McrA
MPTRRWTDDQLVEAVKNSVSYAQVIKALGLSGKSMSSYDTVKRHIARLGIDFSHFTGQAWVGTRDLVPGKIDLEKILVVNSTYQSTSSLKKRLVDDGLLEYRCSICGIDKWLDLPISLHLDHINGINNDNRLENLRLLCPNCHSQTETYAGRNIKKA